MPDGPWPYFRQRKAKVVPFHGNVIPLNPRSAFNPTPLLPRRLLPTLECELCRILADYFECNSPVELMTKLCLAYRSTARSESTVALGWARLLAKDLRWRLYEGTYEYILFDGYFVKLVDKGISVQAVLLAWIRDVSTSLGPEWLWLPRDELVKLSNEATGNLHLCRLQKAWYASHSLWKDRERVLPSVLRLQDESPLLDGMENFRNLVVGEQLRRIAKRVEEHSRQL